MELLIRIVDKPKSGDIEIDSQRTTAGDVIAYGLDGHVWGTQELLNPDWRIVRVVGMTEIESQALTGVELKRSLFANRLLRKRQFQLDVVALGLTNERTAIQNGYDAIVNLDEIRRCRSLKPEVNDPRVFGKPKGVIG